MPKENKRRGRIREKKRKRDQYEKGFVSFEDHYSEVPHQAAENGDIEVQGDAGDDFISFGETASQLKRTLDDMPFYGLLDQQEQEYYANVNAKLEVNDFESPEDKAIFLDAVFRESQGKELKIASSQSCSRYLERLICISSDEQVRGLFGKFVGHFLQLVQHRFASHCCEALFLKAAEGVGEDDIPSEQESATPSREQLFLTVVDELQPNLGYLLTERFASHVVRVLLLVLSGEPLNDVSTTSVLASRKKEKIEAFGGRDEDLSTGPRHVPRSFNDALSRVISSSVSSLDTTYIRALATHPTGNPVLQLLLRLELLQGGKSKAKDADSVLHRLLPDDAIAEDTESAKFIQGLLYDPTGSRLLETIIQHAPGKLFKKLYGNLLKQRIGAMAKNDTASYVAIRILERLSKEDLQGARDEILPEMSTLVARNRLVVIRVLVERCDIRHVDLGPVVSALQTAYRDSSSDLLLSMLNTTAPPVSIRAQLEAQQIPQQEENFDKTTDIHGSLLAQTLLRVSYTFNLIHQSIQSLPADILLRLAKDPAASRVLQAALTSPPSTPSSNRTIIPKFYNHISDLATHPSGSHLVDALWHATNGSHFMKERLAKELQANEAELRASRYGRVVWRNWNMDVYQRRPGEWQALAKGGLGEQENGDRPRKSRLELARERFSVQKTRGKSTGQRAGALAANA